MYSDREKKKRIWPLILAALIVLTLGVWLFVRAADSPVNRESGANAIREMIESSARQCYAVEGVYPPDLAYLEDNYGLQINTEDYYVMYDIYASNQPPSVKVVGK